MVPPKVKRSLNRLFASLNTPGSCVHVHCWVCMLLGGVCWTGEAWREAGSWLWNRQTFLLLFILFCFNLGLSVVHRLHSSHITPLSWLTVLSILVIQSGFFLEQILDPLVALSTSQSRFRGVMLLLVPWSNANKIGGVMETCINLGAWWLSFVY